MKFKLVNPRDFSEFDLTGRFKDSRCALKQKYENLGFQYRETIAPNGVRKWEAEAITIKIKSLTHLLSLTDFGDMLITAKNEIYLDHIC